MMILKNSLFVCLFLGLSLFDAQAQEAKVLGLPLEPYNFERPIDLFDNQGRLENLYQPCSRKSKEIAWLVISDRENNKTYSAPEGEENGKVIHFKESFYVTKELGDWIRIAKGRVDGLKLSEAQDFGWVQKSKMLIWGGSLVKESSGAREKAFVALRAARNMHKESFINNCREVPMYEGPQTSVMSGNLHTTTYYYIYKKEGNRYLVGLKTGINVFNCEKILLGWVSQNFALEWNTRVCLEPNFEEAAFLERKTMPEYGWRIYEGNTWAKDKIMYAVDPANSTDYHLISPINPKRMTGSSFRSPLIAAQTDFYKTAFYGDVMVKDAHGVLQKIDLADWSSLLRAYQKSCQKLERFNVLFLIEGTGEMNENKDQIIRGIESVGEIFKTVPYVHFGAAVYRQPDLNGQNPSILLKKMTIDLNAVSDFVRNMPFKSTEPPIPYTGLYDALKKSLLDVGLNKNETNIVFIIGNNADFKADNILRAQAEENHAPALIESEAIIDLLKGLKAHVHVLQWRNKNDRSSHYFLRQGHNFILQNARMQYQDLEELKKVFTDIDHKYPDLQDIELGNSMKLSHSPIPGSIFYPPSGKSLTSSEFLQTMADVAKLEISQINETQRILNSIFGCGKPMPFTGDSIQAALAYLKDIIDKSEIEASTAKLLQYEKIQFLYEGNIPKIAYNAKHPLSSQVVFMSDYDLRDYLGDLRRCILDWDGPNSQKRRALMSAVCTALFHIRGGAYDSDQCSNESLLFTLQMLSSEGIAFVDEEQKQILDGIMDAHKHRESDLDHYIQRIEEKCKNLEKILRMGIGYDLSWTDGEDVYYWIPISDLF